MCVLTPQVYLLTIFGTDSSHVYLETVSPVGSWLLTTLPNMYVLVHVTKECVLMDVSITTSLLLSAIHP